MALPSDNLLVSDINQTFPFHHLMIKWVENYALKVGFIAVDRPKDNFKESNWSFNHPFAPKTPKQGMIYCSSKSPGRYMRSVCTWKVIYHVTNSVYIFMSKTSKLMHSHHVAPKALNFDGQFEVTMVNQLTSTNTIFYNDH